MAEQQPRTKINFKVPLWVSILQTVLVLIMLQQVYLFTFDHAAVAASGIAIDGTMPNLNLLYEFAARTATMALISIFVLVSQNPRYFIPVLGMNIIREGLETFIDPLFPLSNAPVGPTADLITHVVIVVVEILALITVYRVVRRMNAAEKAATNTSENPAGAV
jgi:hypothetical protein